MPKIKSLRLFWIRSQFFVYLGWFLSMSVSSLILPLKKKKITSISHLKCCCFFSTNKTSASAFLEYSARASDQSHHPQEGPVSLWSCWITLTSRSLKLTGQQSQERTSRERRDFIKCEDPDAPSSPVVDTQIDASSSADISTSAPPLNSSGSSVIPFKSAQTSKCLLCFFEV